MNGASRASTSIVPLSGSWIPAMQRSRVLLPLPLRPITAKNSPGATSNEMSRSASNRSWPKLTIGCLTRSLSVHTRWRGIANDFDSPSTRRAAWVALAGACPSCGTRVT